MFDKYGNTALMLASRNGYLELIKYLCENGANINDKDKVSEWIWNKRIRMIYDIDS